ncbi:MAG: hypothetical protein JRJ62_03310 [Deltaproteobacteria bacterium]|nr:hypothetical protein [Deltaproteobacteria bacterium]
MRFSNPTKEGKPMIRPRRWGIFDRDISTFNQLRDYQWIGNYQKCISLKAEIADLEEMQRKTRSAPLKNSELLNSAKKWFEEYQEHRISMIQAAILNSSHSGSNPFLDLSRTGKLNLLNIGSRDFFGFIRLEEIQSAISRLDDSASLSQKDREKALQHTEKRLAGLKKQLEDLFPKNSQFRMAGAKDSDVRGEFISIWIEVQKQCDAPCGPTGVDLKYSSEAEQRAYKELQIDSFINKNSKFKPYDQYEKKEIEL